MATIIRNKDLENNRLKYHKAKARLVSKENDLPVDEIKVNDIVFISTNLFFVRIFKTLEDLEKDNYNFDCLDDKDELEIM